MYKKHLLLLRKCRTDIANNLIFINAFKKLDIIGSKKMDKKLKKLECIRLFIPKKSIFRLGLAKCNKFYRIINSIYLLHRSNGNINWINVGKRL